MDLFPQGNIFSFFRASLVSRPVVGMRGAADSASGCGPSLQRLDRVCARSVPLYSTDAPTGVTSALPRPLA